MSIILCFKNDDANFTKWVKENKNNGFVYNNFGGQNIDYKKLHKSNCPFIEVMNTNYEKICCVDLQELISWLNIKKLEYSLDKSCIPEMDSKSIAQNKLPVIESNANHDSQKVVDALINFGKGLKPQKMGGTMTGDMDADNFLRENHFAFLMAACIDRGAKAEIIWTIPYLLFQTLGHLDPSIFANFTKEQIEQHLRSLNKKPRYPGQAAQTIKELSEMIADQFNSDAKNLWRDKEPNEIVKILTSIKGVGQGISHMVVRILVDEFDYDPGLNGYKQINVKPDVHVIRVFYRTGLVDKRNDKLCIKAAQNLHPDYPGLLD